MKTSFIVVIVVIALIMILIIRRLQRNVKKPTTVYDQASQDSTFQLFQELQNGMVQASAQAFLSCDNNVTRAPPPAIPSDVCIKE